MKRVIGAILSILLLIPNLSFAEEKFVAFKDNISTAKEKAIVNIYKNNNQIAQIIAEERKIIIRDTNSPKNYAMLQLLNGTKTYINRIRSNKFKEAFRLIDENIYNKCNRGEITSECYKISELEDLNNKAWRLYFGVQNPTPFKYEGEVFLKYLSNLENLNLNIDEQMTKFKFDKAKDMSYLEIIDGINKYLITAQTFPINQVLNIEKDLLRVSTKKKEELASYEDKHNLKFSDSVEIDIKEEGLNSRFYTLEFNSQVFDKNELVYNLDPNGPKLTVRLIDTESTTEVTSRMNEDKTLSKEGAISKNHNKIVEKALPFLIQEKCSYSYFDEFDKDCYNKFKNTYEFFKKYNNLAIELLNNPKHDNSELTKLVVLLFGEDVRPIKYKVKENGSIEYEYMSLKTNKIIKASIHFIHTLIKER